MLASPCAQPVNTRRKPRSEGSVHILLLGAETRRRSGHVLPSSRLKAQAPPSLFRHLENITAGFPLPSSVSPVTAVSGPHAKAPQLYLFLFLLLLLREGHTVKASVREFFSKPSFCRSKLSGIPVWVLLKHVITGIEPTISSNSRWLGAGIHRASQRGREM